jgi:uncharacterized Rossmann fold enzyme
MLSLNEWLNYYYNVIVKRLGIDPGKDVYAAKLLNNLIGKHGFEWDKLYELINDKNVLVFMPGPSLERVLGDVSRSRNTLLDQNSVILSVDGATEALYKYGIIPDIIVSDLDGDIESIINSGLRGSIIVVHAHGDNIDKLRKYVSLMIENNIRVLGTTQVKPYGVIHNFGGFTDGDRAVFLAAYHGARRIIILGMDLGYIIGKYSKRDIRNKPVLYMKKLVKLSIARELLELVACNKNSPPIYSLPSNVRVRCITNICLDKLYLLLRS